MPIDARIPLGVTGLDPNGFTNALAAGVKMREVQNASDRLAAKEDLATAKSNALSTYGASKRGPEDRAAVWAADPASGIALDKAAAENDKNTREAGLAGARTEKLTAEAGKAKLLVMRQAASALPDAPTEEEFNTVADWADGQSVDSKLWRTQWANTPPERRPDLVKRWKMSVGEALKVADASRPQPKFFDDGTFLPDTAHPEEGVRPLLGKEPKAEPQKYMKTSTGGQAPLNPDGTLGPTVAGTEPTPKPSKPPTEGQARAGLLVGEAELADNTMKDLEGKGYDPTSRVEALFDRIADMGGMTTSWLASSQGQTYLSAAREFVAAGAYGKSGASLTETEWENGRQTYIPMPGDGKERMAFKAAARARLRQGMHMQAGPADHAAPTDERAELERLRALKAARGGS
jgi:hypothetical protein